MLEIIKKRRSIRQYKADTVPDEMLNIVLEAARWAPSWKNTQCWRFIVVKDNETKTKLAETLTEKNRAFSAMTRAPIIIVACAQLGKSGYTDGQLFSDKKDAWYMYDVALAMQNLTLAAAELGLGTVHVGSFDAQKAAQILNVPSDISVVVMTPLGYPDQEYNTVPRKELKELVFYETM